MAVAAAVALALVFVVFDGSGAPAGEAESAPAEIEPTIEATAPGEPTASAATTEETESSLETSPPPPAYVELVEEPLSRLTASAEALGRALSGVARPADIRRVRETATRELSVVRAVRRKLEALDVEPADQASHARLVEAAAGHAQLLRLLVRATSSNTRQALTAVSSAADVAQTTIARYRALFDSQPALPDLITASGIEELAGLRGALQTRLITAPGPSRPGGVGVPAVYTGYFTAVDRLERCFARNESVVCSAGPSGKVASLEVGVGAFYEGVLGSRDNGGPSMPMGTSFRTPAGTIECGSSTRGITCTDLTTGAYFVIGDYYVRIGNRGAEQRY